MKNRAAGYRLTGRPPIGAAAALMLTFVLGGADLDGPDEARAEPIITVQSDDPARVLRRQQQYTATVQALRTLEAMLASATLNDEARAHMRSQLDGLLRHFEGSHGAELKIARLKLEMHDLREKQGGAISGGNIDAFADQERRLRQRELEILLQIRELEREIERAKQ